MPAREALAFVAIPLLLAVILLAPAWGFLGVLGVAVLLAGSELLRMIGAAGIPVGRTVPLVALAAALLAAWLFGGSGLLIALGCAAVILPAAQLLHPRRPEGALAGVAAGLFVAVYLGFTGACLGWLRQLPDDAWGVRFILFFLAVIWIGDSGAYYVGRTWGRHRMAPRISPKKTWEGLAGGVAASYAAAAAARVGFGLDLAWLDTLAVATILAVAAPLGDLVESQIKRDTGVKDSSALLPGHGGFLDRTDSLLYAAPVVLGYLLLARILP